MFSSPSLSLSVSPSLSFSAPFSVCVCVCVCVCVVVAALAASAGWLDLVRVYHATGLVFELFECILNFVVFTRFHEDHRQDLLLFLPSELVLMIVLLLLHFCVRWRACL